MEPNKLSDKARAILDAIAKGARSTWFLAAGNPVTARKKWIAGSLEPRGTLFIDAGAVTLRSGATTAEYLVGKPGAPGTQPNRPLPPRRASPG